MLTIHLFAASINRGEVVEHKLQDLAWAIATSHFGWAIEAVELEFDGVRWIGIVVPHPLHQFSIGVEPTKAVAKAAVLHGLIRCLAATSQILVDEVRPGETALDGNGTVAMRLDQMLKESVA